MLGNAPCTSRNSTDATFLFLHPSLILCVRSRIESVVHRKGLLPNWFGGKTFLVSQKWLSLSATIEENNFPSVLSGAIGR